MAVWFLLAALLASTLITSVAAVSEETSAVIVLTVIIIIFILLSIVLLVVLIVFCLWSNGRIQWPSWWPRRGSYDIKQPKSDHRRDEFITSPIRLQLRRKPSTTPELSPVETVAPISYESLELPQIKVIDETGQTEKKDLQSSAPGKDIVIENVIESENGITYESSTQPKGQISDPESHTTSFTVATERLVSVSSSIMGPTSPIPSPLPPVSEDIKELDFSSSFGEASTVQANQAIHNSQVGSHTSNTSITLDSEHHSGELPAANSTIPLDDEESSDPFASLKFESEGTNLVNDFLNSTTNTDSPSNTPDKKMSLGSMGFQETPNHNGSYELNGHKHADPSIESQ